MNERYTYGYSNATIENNAWNIENEYINSLNEVIEDYNNQVKKIEEINSSVANAEIDTEPSIKTTTITSTIPLNLPNQLKKNSNNSNIKKSSKNVQSNVTNT